MDWAEEYVQIFNELSRKYETSYYTQSPLSAICPKRESIMITTDFL